MSRGGPRPTWPVWVPCLLAALLAVQVVGTPSTNFGGFDEWLVLDLVSRGIVNAPYANRPLNFLWLRPASWLPGYAFGSFALVFVVYTVGGALVLYGLSRRLMPGRPVLAWLAAAFFLVWFPGDLSRLSTIDRVHYAGITFGTLVAGTLLVEAWVRDRLALLALALALAVVAAETYEGILPLLAGVPLLLRPSRAERRRWWGWILPWEGTLAVVGAVAAAPILGFGPRHVTYQGSVLGLSAGPLTWASRVGWQYIYHLFPLATSSPSELLAWKAPVSAMLLALGIVVSARSAPEGEPGRGLGKAMLAGLAFAGLGYSLVVLGMAAPSAYRLQYLSGPGISVFLAALVCGVGGLPGARWRVPVTVALAGWIAAVGAGRLVAMQGIWDRGSSYPKQSAMLRGLTGLAPDLEAGTMVVVLDDGAAWKATYTFAHAVRYLYRGHAAGCVWKSWPFLYRTAFEADGLRFDPWPEIREAFDVSPHTYRWDEIVVVRFMPSGEAKLVKAWPPELPPLPEGARYDPQTRIVTGGAPITEQAVLADSHGMPSR